MIVDEKNSRRPDYNCWEVDCTALEPSSTPWTAFCTGRYWKREAEDILDLALACMNQQGLECILGSVSVYYIVLVQVVESRRAVVEDMSAENSMAEEEIGVVAEVVQVHCFVSDFDSNYEKSEEDSHCFADVLVAKVFARL